MAQRMRKRIKAAIIGLLGFIVLLCVLFGILWATAGRGLSFKGMLAMVTYGNFDLPESFCSYVLDVDRSYPGLPALLAAEDGKPVTDRQAYETRRQEMLVLCQTYLYGEIPIDGFETTFTVVESGPALSGKAIRQQVRITVSNDSGSTDAMLLVYLPAGGQQCPVFAGLNFSGNTAVWHDEQIHPSAKQEAVQRGSEAESWPIDQIIGAGCGVATMYYEDWALDDAHRYTEGLLRLFPEQNCTAYSAWAFGLMRGIDYLQQLPQVNTNAIATVGHSRLARVSLWAGANDERIDLVTGSCGGGYWRSPLLADIDPAGEHRHWFTKAHLSFAENDGNLPVDMHMLYALIADRQLYISMGAQDLASDPVSMYDALQQAKKVWKEVYEMDVIPDGNYADLAPGVPQFSQGIAVHIHHGGHELNSTDWANYIAYLQKYVLDPEAA